MYIENVAIRISGMNREERDKILAKLGFKSTEKNNKNTFSHENVTSADFQPNLTSI